MSQQKPTLLVLAAGMGSRYGGNKQIDGFGPNGETIVEYSIFDAIRARFGKVVFIVREEILDLVKDKFVPKIEGKIAYDFVIQSLQSHVPAAYQNPDRVKPYGTAHAVLCAKDAINEPFAVINADDFYGQEAFQILSKFLTENKDANRHAMVGYALKNVLSENGTVSRGICDTDAEGFLAGMTERTSIARVGDKIISKENDGELVLSPEVATSMNCWGFKSSFFDAATALWEDFLKDNHTNIKSEFYIPTVANHLINSGKSKIEILKGGTTWFGVTYTEDKPEVISSLKKLHDQGTYPKTLWS
ncbi:sugar phosphate nucleotidyltransferase [Penaeicola halotolerans]|uniref:sugar phosphate nucleotidyltransferase n=1 Tax=Penaeicola halotolerans TaxID=2793196 RepID=UPI001CF82903|nr:sugar phosphate nucleotidyltransferase [Penaeicola halotolerans]